MRERLIALILMACLLGACAQSEEAKATSAVETQKAQEYEALAATATKLAGPSDTLTVTSTASITPTATQTPTPSETPLPSFTPTPPEGSAYVPDLVGLTYEEATQILKDLELPWYYVAVIDKDTPTGQVIEQSPRPGALLDLEEMQVKLVVSFSASSPPRPQPRVGYFFRSPCGDLTEVGVCFGGSVFWCDGNKVLVQDCSFCNGYCGYNREEEINTCFCP